MSQALFEEDTITALSKAAQRVPGAHTALARGLVGKGQASLECPRCRTTQQLTEKDVATHLSNGWPKCCGETMHLLVSAHGGR